MYKCILKYFYNFYNLIAVACVWVSLTKTLCGGSEQPHLSCAAAQPPALGPESCLSAPRTGH